MIRWWCWKTYFATWRWDYPPREGSRKGRHGSSLAVLAATSTTSIVFFPVTFLLRHQQVHLHAAGSGCRAFDLRILFFRYDGGSVLLLAVFIRSSWGRGERDGPGRTPGGSRAWYNCMVPTLLTMVQRVFRERHEASAPYSRAASTLRRLVAGTPSLALSVLGRGLLPAHRPGQFVINVHMPSGTRLEVSDQYVAKARERDPQAWCKRGTWG